MEKDKISKIIMPAKLRGRVRIPSSKSVAHRAIICASLAGGKSVISNISMSDDIKATVGCMRALGAIIKQEGDTLVIDGATKGLNKDLTFDCNESGSTLRFMIPIALAVNSGKNVFIGKGKLGSRPLDIYQKICKEQGILFSNDSAKNADGLLDLTAQGRLKSGKFTVDGGVSSQFLTGLMFALPMLDGDSEITVEGDLQSVGYIDLTLSTLSDFGIEYERDGYRRFLIKGGQKYTPRDFEVEGDWSQAAFFEVANYLGSDVEIKGLRADSKQGDKVIVEFLDRLRAAKEDETLVFDGGDCPDIIPVFALACCLRKGVSKIVNVSRLKIKECDRLSATAGELSKLGANVTADGDSMTIVGVDKLCGGKVSTHNDHRMAMMLAIAATRATSAVELDNWKCVAKSYPRFFDDLHCCNLPRITVRPSPVLRDLTRVTDRGTRLVGRHTAARRMPHHSPRSRRSRSVGKLEKM